MTDKQKLVFVVCGGRDFNDYDYVKRHLMNAVKGYGRPPTLLVSGGDKNGADALGIRWAREWNIPYKVVNANWDKHGKAAGPIRNSEMLNDYEPDCVVAFPGGTGTADTLKKARAKGIRVYESEYYDKKK